LRKDDMPADKLLKDCTKKL